VLSLTALKLPTTKLLLDHPNVKCKIVPSTITKIVLKISNFKIDFALFIYASL
jgi:hypothetical protein